MKIYTLVAVLGASACTDPAIGMSLELPPPADLVGFDVSCVTAVDVVAHEVGEEEALDVGLRLYDTGDREPCVEITPQTSLADIRDQLRGKVEIDLPDNGLAGIQIRGRAGTCRDNPNYHEAVFYGGAVYDDADMKIQLRTNVACNSGASYKVRPVDISAMLADATHACRPVTDAIATFSGTIRPSKLDPIAAPLMFEAGNAVSLLGSDGTTMVSSFTGAGMKADACVAIAHEGQLVDGLTCLNKGAPTLCGAAGEIEVPVVPFVYLSTAMNNSAYDASGTLVLGSVWETNPNKPVENAVVTPTKPGVIVDYVEMSNNGLEILRGATKTGPSGLFILYSGEITNVSIAAPGHQTRVMTVGGGWELDGSVIAVLPKM